MKITVLSAFASLILFSAAGQAQGNPDCQFTDTFTAVVAGPSHANTGTPCVAWRLTYSAVGMTALSIQIEGAPWNSGGTGPGTFVAIASAAILQGTNPLTDPNSGTLVVQGTVYFPFIRLNVTVFTPTGASGTITARLYGYKGTSAAAISGADILSNPMLALGDMIYGTAGGTPARLPANTTTNPDCLVEMGDGTNGGIPAFGPCPTNGTLTYYITPTASDLTNGSAIVTQDVKMLTPPYSPITNIDIAHNAAGDVILQSVATDPGFPGVTFIPAGVYTFHIHAERLSGNRAVTLYGVFREVTAAGVAVGTIGTLTESTPALTGSQLEYVLQMPDGNTYTMALITSRIVLDIHAVFTGGSTNTTVRLFVGGTADSHMSLPSNTVDATSFVPYTGATAALNLGTQALILNGSTVTGVWTQTTPTPTCAVGAFTTVSGILHTLTLGKTVFLNLAITITTNGTCAAAIFLPLPFSAAFDNSLSCSAEVASVNGNGVILPSFGPPYDHEVAIGRYDGTFLGGDGEVIVCNGVIQIP